jgi:hypothetical protein
MTVTPGVLIFDPTAITPLYDQAVQTQPQLPGVPQNFIDMQAHIGALCTVYTSVQPLDYYAGFQLGSALGVAAGLALGVGRGMTLAGQIADGEGADERSAGLAVGLGRGVALASQVAEGDGADDGYDDGYAAGRAEGYAAGVAAGRAATLTGLGPVVSAVSPPAGTSITPTTVIGFSVEDQDGVSATAVTIVVRFLDGTSSTAWDGSSFGGAYGGSTVTPATNGQAFELAAIWPQTIAAITIAAADELGNSSTTTIGSWITAAATVTPPAGPDPIPDTSRIGSVIPVIDYVALAVSRLPEYLLPH